MAGLLEIHFKLNFQNRGYKRLLNKLKTLMKYCATIGIHKEQGKNPVYKRYSVVSTKGNTISHISGRSHRMNIAKLAYQNEFGANILIRPRYKTVTKTQKHTLQGPNFKTTQKTVTRYSTLRNEQGYLLLDKHGNYVSYFKPLSIIHIPERSFIRKTVNEPDPKMISDIQDVLSKTFIKGGFTAHKAIDQIAQIVTKSMKNNVHTNQKTNHPLTIKAKGFNSPLTDEQDRIYNAIKYKIYKDFKQAGTRGHEAYIIQRKIHTIDKLLKSADQFINYGVISRDISYTTFKYKNSNPNFGF